MNAVTFDYLKPKTLMTDEQWAQSCKSKEEKRREQFRKFRSAQRSGRLRDKLIHKLLKSQKSCPLCGKTFNPDGIFRDRPFLVENDSGPFLICFACDETSRKHP